MSEFLSIIIKTYTGCLHFSLKHIFMHSKDANSWPVPLCTSICPVLHYLSIAHGIKSVRHWGKKRFDEFIL